jgi:hypothetical protein
MAEAAEAAIVDAVLRVPGVWLGERPEERQADFEAFLRARLDPPRAFVTEAEGART